MKNEVSGTTEVAVVAGALIGALLTFAFPLAGMAIGAAVGAAVGALLDTGVSGNFIDMVKATLRPGRSARFLVVKEADADALLAALRNFRGHVIQRPTTAKPRRRCARPWSEADAGQPRRLGSRPVLAAARLSSSTCVAFAL